MSIKSRSMRVEVRHLAEDEFAPENVKVRITTFIDVDIVKQLRIYAKKNKTRYQTALNSILRSFFEDPTRDGQLISFDQKVRQIVKEEMKQKK